MLTVCTQQTLKTNSQFRTVFILKAMLAWLPEHKAKDKFPRKPEFHFLLQKISINFFQSNIQCLLGKGNEKIKITGTNTINQ